MRREVAKKQTQRAQIAAIVLLAVAGGVLVMPSLFVSRAGEPEAAPPAPKVTHSKTTTTTAELTTAALSQQDLSEILEGIRPPAPPPSQVEATPVTPDQPVQPPVAEAPWRYIGVILGPSREAHRAIVTVGESQRMLSEGEQVDQDRVDEITSDYLLVTGAGGTQRKIDMAARKRLDLVITPGGTGDEMQGVVAGHVLTADEQNKLDNAARHMLKDPSMAAYVQNSKAEQQGREPTDANVLGAYGEKIVRAMNRSGTVAPGSNRGSGSDDDGSMLNSALGRRLAQLRRLRDTGQLTAAEYAQRAAEANAAANDQLPPTNPPPPPPAPAPVNPNGAGGGTTTTGSR